MLALTGGKRAKLAWEEYQGGGGDTYSNGEQHYLMGFDTADGRGARVILGEKSNYSRPLITPGGERLLYTNKNIERKKSSKHYDPDIWAVNWDGTGHAKLAPGMAVDVWRDPVTGEDWVVAARDFQPTNRAQLFAKRLVRFPLADPSKDEPLWEAEGTISVDNIQLSRAGDRASGLFPWPSCGMFDFKAGAVSVYENGCWPAAAPDDSGIMWIFDGAHRNLRFFKAGGEVEWTVPASRGPGLDGYEVYHPRWSNHPRFLCLSGPYIGKEKGKSTISAGSDSADIFVGKLGDKLEAIEGWARVTQNKLGDFYPDLWIEGGGDESLDPDKVGPAQAAPVAADPGAKLWPQNREGIAFLWDNARHPGEIGTRVFTAEAHRYARFGRHYEMRPAGGFFDLKPEFVAAVNQAAAETGALTLEIGISHPAPGRFFAFEGADGTGVWLDAADGGDLRLRAVWIDPDGTRQDSVVDAPVDLEAGATDLVVTLAKSGSLIAFNGDHLPLGDSFAWLRPARRRTHHFRRRGRREVRRGARTNRHPQPPPDRRRDRGARRIILAPPRLAQARADDQARRQAGGSRAQARNPGHPRLRALPRLPHLRGHPRRVRRLHQAHDPRRALRNHGPHRLADRSRSRQRIPTDRATARRQPAVQKRFPSRGGGR
ncbi:MAG: hypothetical protein R3F11_11685 [Verrucomicrobiales bacterium]